MNEIGIGIGIDSVSGGWNVNKSLSLLYSSRSGLDLLETKSGLNLNAKIIPSCGICDENNYANAAVSDFGGNDTSGWFKTIIYYDGSSSGIIIWSSADTANATRFFQLQILNGKPTIQLRDAAVGFLNTHQATNAISVGWHAVDFYSVDGHYRIDVDGLTVASSSTAGNDDGKWLGDVGSPTSARDNVVIGRRIYSSATASTPFNVAMVNYYDKNIWYVTGVGNYIFDVVEGVNLTWTGSAHQVYDLGALSHLLNIGYTKYTKAGSPDEYVPYTSANTPYDAAAFLTGYTKVADFVGGDTIYNGAPSLVDFDYADGANALVGIFKKDDTDIYISTASMLYYDASNKYRWRNDELLNPAVYSDDYKKVGYKGIIMNKTSVSTIAKSISEILVYSQDQIGNKEWSLAKYCTLEDLVVKSGGSPVFDGDNYLTWV